MNVYCFHTDELRPETRNSVEAVNGIFIDVSKSVWEYSNAVKKIWELGNPFILVEHDMVFKPDVIESLKQCPEKMCLTSYWYSFHQVYDTGVSKWTPHRIDWELPHHWLRLTSWMIGRTIHVVHNHDVAVQHLGSGHVNFFDPRDPKRRQ